MIDYKGACQAAFEICKLQFSWLVEYWEELILLSAVFVFGFVLFAVLRDVRDKRKR